MAKENSYHSALVKIKDICDEVLQTDNGGIITDVLPIGTVLMYNGNGIVNIRDRVTQIGDEEGDTIKMPGWYVCNGKVSTPNLIDCFIRSETTSGNTGGTDSLTLRLENLPVHNHTAVCDYDAHKHEVDPDGDHRHRLATNPGILAGGFWNAGLANDPNRGKWKGDEVMERDGRHIHALTMNKHKHSISINSVGSGGAFDNKPKFYSLIMIIKMGNSPIELESFNENSKMGLEDQKATYTISNKVGINLTDLESNITRDLKQFCTENNINLEDTNTKVEIIEEINKFLNLWQK
ncbi:MAG: hypothetical protein ACFFA3_18470 [Promethearchaeota archaeon]